MIRDPAVVPDHPSINGLRPPRPFTRVRCDRSCSRRKSNEAAKLPIRLRIHIMECLLGLKSKFLAQNPGTLLAIWA